jgi:membrane associated rhomboid family serine protease
MRFRAARSLGWKPKVRKPPVPRLATARREPGLRSHAMLPYADENPSDGPPAMTIGLILLNLFIFLMGLRLDERQLFELHVNNGFIPARIEQLYDPAVQVAVPADAVFRFGQHVQHLPIMLVLPPNRGQILMTVVTCQFLHGGWMHLLGNMLFLWIFGNNVEERLGHLAYLLFYLIGGIFSMLAHYLMNPDSVVPTIGASGAVATILGAYAVSWPHATIRLLLPLGFLFIPLRLPAYIVLGFWFGSQLLDGLLKWDVELSGGVAFFAHIGGFVFGAVVMLVVNKLREERALRETQQSGDLENSHPV